MIDTVFFDMGGVLAGHNWPRVQELICAKSTKVPASWHSKDGSDLLKLLLGNAPFQVTMGLYETGKIETREFIEATQAFLKKELGYTGSYADTLEAHTAILGEEITPTVKIFAKIAKRGEVKLAIISDNNAVHTQVHFEEHPEMMKIIPREHVFLSQETGYSKTSPEAFLIPIERTGSRAENCLMIDDSSHKLEVCKKLGMSTIAFTREMDLVSELAKFGVRV